MKKTMMSEAYETPEVDVVEVVAEGGFSLSDGFVGGSNEDLDDFENMDWGN